MQDVAEFLGHKLTEDALSTLSINDERARRQTPLGKSELWLEFPVEARGKTVETRVRVIPRFADEFFRGLAEGGTSRQETIDAAQTAVDLATGKVTELWLGLGALTKNALDHGESLPKLPEWVHTTHGDAGTVALVLRALQHSRFRPGLRVAVVGAAGVIGRSVALAIGEAIQPASLVLVGRGGSKRREILEGIRREVMELPSAPPSVEVHQNFERACLDGCGVDIIIVATTDTVLLPKHVRDHSVVFDVATPAACPASRWENAVKRLVIKAGYGIMPIALLPRGFGVGVSLDVGAGGERVLWGCLIETIVRALYDKREHLKGKRIPNEEVMWAMQKFAELDIEPQAPPGGMEWKEVGRFV